MQLYDDTISPATDKYAISGSKLKLKTLYSHSHLPVCLEPQPRDHSCHCQRSDRHLQSHLSHLTHHLPSLSVYLAFPQLKRIPGQLDLNLCAIKPVRLSTFIAKERVKKFLYLPLVPTRRYRHLQFRTYLLQTCLSK